MSKTDELKSKNENLFERNTILLNEDERLQKENAELKDELKVLRQSMKDYGAGCYENGLKNGKRASEKDIERQGKLLEKAKELLKRYVPYRQITNSKAYKDLADETEQFISEVEK